MEVFRDLYISANAERMAAAVEQIERSLPTGWVRDHAAEARIHAARPANAPEPSARAGLQPENGRGAVVTRATRVSERTVATSPTVPGKKPPA